MDFVLYPLDIQKCAVDFSSCEYTQRSPALNLKEGWTLFDETLRPVRWQTSTQWSR